MSLGYQHFRLNCITCSSVSIADFEQGSVVKVKKWKHQEIQKRYLYFFKLMWQSNEYQNFLILNGAIKLKKVTVVYLLRWLMSSLSFQSDENNHTSSHKALTYLFSVGIAVFRD